MVDKNRGHRNDVMSFSFVRFSGKFHRKWTSKTNGVIVKNINRSYRPRNDVEMFKTLKETTRLQVWFHLSFVCFRGGRTASLWRAWPRTSPLVTTCKLILAKTTVNCDVLCNLFNSC